MTRQGDVARYQIDGALYCIMCAEQIGRSFIERRRFVPAGHQCPGDLCDQRSVIEKMNDDKCILWTGQVNFKGYGIVGIKQKPRKVHRLEWEKHHGPIPDGLCVLHRCDVRNCYNIKHLFLGTKGDNNRDMHAKGRQRGGAPAGEMHGKAKLTTHDVLEIKSLIAAGETDTAIAKRYDVSPTCIRHIRIGRTWKHTA